MSELDEKHTRGQTETLSRPIPNAPAQQETQSDLSTSVFSYGNEVRCSEQGQESSLSLPSPSNSFVSSPEMRARKEIDSENQSSTPEDAKSYTPAAQSILPPNSKPTVGESDVREKVTIIPTQVVDPDTSFVIVTNKFISEREYSNENSSGYVNLLTEDESSLSTTNSEDTQSSEACSTNTVVEDKAEIHRDPPTTDNIGEDDGLPFHMDDIDEAAPSSINAQDRDQSIQSTEPTGLFTGSLPLNFGNDSNIRPAHVPSNRENTQCQQNGSENSAPPTPTQRSPSTSSASETSTASSHSSASNNTEDIHPEVFKTCQIESSFKRPTLCHSIARLLPQTAFNFRQKFKLYGIKGEFQFHSRGLDQDYKNHNGTLTAVFKFPKKPQRINILNNYENCEFKIAVNVYEGPVSNNRCIGQSSSARSLDDDDRKRGTLHMTVHEVVSLRKIIFTDMDPPVDKIFIQVVVELRAQGHQRSKLGRKCNES